MDSMAVAMDPHDREESMKEVKNLGAHLDVQNQDFIPVWSLGNIRNDLGISMASIASVVAAMVLNGPQCSFPNEKAMSELTDDR
jgi:hypothetical protein